jgi:ABC-type dipeptide/oligopeptide/nickel transport system permease component
MLTYIIRRLLYSTVVLVLASFLVFTFVTVSGDPLAGLRIAPNVSEVTVQNVIDRKHLDDPVPKRYLYWVQDAGHERVRLDAPRQPPDPARALARDEEHAASSSDRQMLVIFFAVLIGVYSAIRQYSASTTR